MRISKIDLLYRVCDLEMQVVELEDKIYKLEKRTIKLSKNQQEYIKKLIDKDIIDSHWKGDDESTK